MNNNGCKGAFWMLHSFGKRSGKKEKKKDGKKEKKKDGKKE